MVILGIDPGTATTGFGLIEYLPSHQRGQFKMQFLSCGCILTPKESLPAERLQTIYKELGVLIKKYHPQIIGIEKLFFCKNNKTAMAVSEARGVILLSSIEHKLPVLEFTPLQVKMAVTGYGKAEKKQVQKMIQVLLRLDKMPTPDDAADALSVAVCLANSLPLRKFVGN